MSDPVLPPVVARDRTSPQAWLTLWILVGLCVLSFLDRQIISLMTKPIRADLGLSDFQFSLLQGLAFGLFYAVCSVPIGWLVDRRPRRVLIWAGVGVWSLATAASGLARSFPHLLLARMGVGAAEATLTPAAYSMISDLFPPRRLALALSIFSTGASIGASLAFLVGGLLISALENVSLSLPGFGGLATWQLTLVCLGLPGLALAFVIFAVREPARRSEKLLAPAADWTEFFAFLKSRARLFSALFVGCGLISMIGYGYLAWLPAYLMRVHGLTILQVGLLMSTLIGASGITGGILSGWFVDRLFARGRRDAHLFYWSWAALAVASLSVAAFAAPNLVTFCLVLVLVQMVLPFSGVAAAAVQITTPDRFRGRTSALFILVFNLLGLGLGATAVAAVTDFVFHDDLKVGQSIAVTAAVLGLLASVLFYSGRKAMRETLARIESRAGADPSA